MPLNAGIAVGMVWLGLGLGWLGRWSAPRIGDAMSGTDHYTKRTEFHKRWSQDRPYRLYVASMGAPPPFENRVLPAWLDKDGKMVYHTLQYKLIQWKEAKIRRNEYYYQNQAVNDVYTAYDIAQYEKHTRGI